MTELIQKYLDDSLTNVEKAEFEIKLKNDPILRQEYELMKDIESELKNNELKEFKNKLSSVSDNYFQSTYEQEKTTMKDGINKRVLFLAASLLILICAVIWGVNSNKTSSPISYYDFTEIYSEGIRSESTQTSPVVFQKKQIVMLLAANKYEEVISLLRNNNNDESLTLLLGHAYLLKGISDDDNNLESIQSAINTVSHLKESENLTTRYEAEWILLLSYSKSPEDQDNFNELLDSILTNYDHSFYGRAKEIKENIN